MLKMQYEEPLTGQIIHLSPAKPDPEEYKVSLPRALSELQTNWGVHGESPPCTNWGVHGELQTNWGVHGELQTNWGVHGKLQTNWWRTHFPSDNHQYLIHIAKCFHKYSTIARYIIARLSHKRRRRGERQVRNNIAFFFPQFIQRLILKYITFFHLKLFFRKLTCSVLRVSIPDRAVSLLDWQVCSLMYLNMYSKVMNGCQIVWLSAVLNDHW